MGTPQPDTGWTVFVLPSSHNDIGWAGTPSEIAEHRASAILDDVLSIMEEDPNYTFTIEAALYLHEYLERRPERLDLVSRYIAEGRLECGGTYIQPYEGLLSGESLLRQVYWGRRWIRKDLGLDAAGYWNIDVEARTTQLPQVMSKAGIRYMVLSRNQPGLYWWQAPDGSRILVLSFMEGMYGRSRVFSIFAPHFSPLEGTLMYSPAGTLDIESLAEGLVPLLEQWEPFFADRQLPRYILIAATADYSVPDARLQALVRDWDALVKNEDLKLPMPVRLRFGNVAQYVAALEREADLSTLDTVKGELPNPWVYIHGPCHHKTVSAMRAAARYLPMAEMLTVASDVVGNGADQVDKRDDAVWSELASAWQAHLYPDHGYGGLHGEGTDEIFRYKEETAWYKGRSIAYRAMTDIAQSISLPGEAVRNLVVFNPLSWQRTDWAEAEVIFTTEDTADGVRLIDSDGQPVTIQVLDLHRTDKGYLQRIRIGFIAHDIPSMGYRTYQLVPTDRNEVATEPSVLEAEIPADYMWENSYLRARVGQGGLVEYFDKIQQSRLLAPDHFLGFEVIELGSPGHDVGEGERDLTTGAWSTSWDWRTMRPFQPTASGLERTYDRGGALRLVEDGPVRTRVMTESSFSHCKIRQTFTFFKDLSRVDVQVEVDNWTGTHGRELRLLFPLGVTQAQISYDVPYGHVVIGEDELEGFADLRPREVQNWLHASQDGFTATLSSSVVAHDWVDPLGFTDRPVLQAVLLSTKRSCHWKGPWYTQEGNHRFSASITGTAQSLEDRTHFGWARQQPLEVISVGRKPTASAKTRPPVESFLAVEPDNVIVTSFKWAEEGDDVVVRLCEISGKKTDVTLQCGMPVRAVWQCDLLEDEQVQLLSGAEPTRQVSTSIAPFAITTLKLKR